MGTTDSCSMKQTAEVVDEYTQQMDKIDEGEVSMQPEVDALFKPFESRNLTLRNRIVMAPMTRAASPGGIPTDDMRAWYRRRAQNGVGLIVSEGVRIPHPAAHDDDCVPCFYGDEALGEWARILDDVHRAGAKMMPQLWHIGLFLKPELDNFYDASASLSINQCGPSGMIGGMNIMPTKSGLPMTQGEIDAVVEAFAIAAETAYRMGFDGVEVHAAHGYLIDQFLWDETNLRDDRYGGSLQRRSTFAAEIVTAIRSRTSAQFPIVFRFSQWKLQNYQATLAQNPQELEEVLRPLVEAGVDLFDCSARRYWEPEFKGSSLNLAAWTKKVTGVPTIMVGSVGLNNEMILSFMGDASKTTSIIPAIDMVARGEVDLLAIGRGILANPNWPMLVRNGAWDDIKPYVPEMMERIY